MTHFIGIGGIGMSALAYILLKQGRPVSGSDIKESALTKKLRRLGARIFIGHKAGNVGGAGTVVYSSSIARNNPELRRARKAGLEVIHRSVMLGRFANSKQLIAVSGTHGKTTVTALISLILTEAGLKPTCAVGSVLDEFKGNARFGQGRHFVAEADESDGSFMELYPRFIVLTNIDREHLDFYSGVGEIKKLFSQWVRRMGARGVLVYCRDDMALRQIARAFGGRAISYGFTKGAEFSASRIVMRRQNTRYRLLVKGRPAGTLRLRIPGQHNVLNSLGAIALARHLGISWPDIRKALASYRGAERRFRMKHCAGNILVVDDYAHHPREIQSTLEGARLWGRRLICVFEPHRYTRTHLLEDEFSRCFGASDKLIITDIYAASEKPIPGVTSRRLAAEVWKRGRCRAEYVPKNRLLGYVHRIKQPGDMILFMGAGDISRLAHTFEQEL